MRIRYASVSNGEQKLDLQLHAVGAARCEKTYTNTISDPTSSRLEFDTCLEYLREDKPLVVWCLDRFGRSLRYLVAKIEALDERCVAIVYLTEGIDTTTRRAGWHFTPVAPWWTLNARLPGSADGSTRSYGFSRRRTSPRFGCS